MLSIRSVLLILFLSVCITPMAFAQESSKVDEDALRASLLGTWASVAADGTVLEHNLKFWGAHHWSISQRNPENGQVIYHHGGTYTLEGNIYTEYLEYATENTESMIGMQLKFRISVDGDTFTQVGIGNDFNSKYVRLKSRVVPGTAK